MQNTSGIHPLGRQLLVDVSPKDQQTAAGIFLPVAVQGASTRMEGVIVDFGPDCIIFSLVPGVSVYVAKWASGELDRNGRKYKLALETDIIASLDAIGASMPDPVSAIPPIHPGI